MRLRILDLAGPPAAFCARLFVGLGAEVIRVESPADPLPLRGDLATLHWHAGKRSVALDLTTDAGRAGFLRLAASSDVLVESFAPGHLEARGLGWEALRAASPGLVLVSVTPFGRTGPRAAWGGTDLTAAALGGMMHLCGDADGPPLRPPGEQAYHLAGVNAAVGALLALHARRRTGHGQRVDVSVQEAVAATLEYGAVAWIHAGVVHRRRGSRYPYVPHQVFRARDGHVAGGLGGNPRMWDDLCAWLAETGTAADLLEPRWQDERVRIAGRDHIVDVLAAFIAKFAKADFAREAQRRRLPWAAVDRADEVARNPQLEARGFFVEAAMDGLVTRDVGFAFRWRGTPLSRLTVPSRGEANTALLDRPSTPTAGGEGLWGISEPGDPTPGGGGSEIPESPSPPSTRRRAALEGVRVLDLTWVLAGPYATKILADHGAEVIKVESRHRPDVTRFGRGLYLSRRADHHPDASGYFNNFNRNKRSVALNLRRPEAVEVLRALAARSDVVVENFSAGVLARWGLDYPGLRALRRDAILVSMSGMGQAGPWRDYLTYADVLAALSGLTAQLGMSGRDPVGAAFGLGDMVAGLHAALGALAALEDRAASGEGQHVDLSQVEALAAQAGTSILESTARGHVAGPEGNRHPVMAPHGAFRCRGEDRWCAIAVEDDGGWRALCAIMERPALAADPRFATAAQRKAHEDALDAIVDGWMAGQEVESVMRRLQSAGIAAGAVQDGRDLVERDEHLRARGFYEVVTHPVVGAFPHEGIVARLEDTPGHVWHSAPCLGEHTREVLHGVLGMEPGEIERLRTLGALE
ncbi:MAG: CoA transferase [Candidatus Rokubacteria bacterium]|nr:CoA transferase [Candidatus Rokubacteria bacterium]